MDLDNTNKNKQTKGSINPLLEKFLAVTLGVSFAAIWVLIIAFSVRFLMFLFG